MRSSLPISDSAPSRQKARQIYGNGEMAGLTRAFDWSKTPVGPIDSWPDVLLTTVNLLLATRNPMLKQKRAAQSSTLSIGLATHDGSFVPVIPRDTVLPTKVVKTYGVSENQSKLLLTIYEGEHAEASKNHLLGQFALSCQPRTEKSTVQVSFIIDINGALKVTANIPGSDKSETLKIEGVKTRQTAEEVLKKYS